MRENGRKGGAPQGNANASKQPKQPNRKQNKLNDNENDNDNDNELLEKKSIKEKPRHIHGEYSKVRLTEEEYLKLGDDAEDLIKILDEYKARSGKTYKSDYAAINTWVKDALNEKRAKQKPPVILKEPVYDESLNPEVDMSDLDEFLRNREDKR